MLKVMKAWDRKLCLHSLCDRNEQKDDGSSRKYNREYVEGLKVVMTNSD